MTGQQRDDSRQGRNIIIEPEPERPRRRREKEGRVVELTAPRGNH